MVLCTEILKIQANQIRPIFWTFSCNASKSFSSLTVGASLFMLAAKSFSYGQKETEIQKPCPMLTLACPDLRALVTQGAAQKMLFHGQ